MSQRDLNEMKVKDHYDGARGHEKYIQDINMSHNNFSSTLT